MFNRLSDLAIVRSRRVLLVGSVLFLASAILGSPVVSLLKSESSDFQDPSAQNQQVLRTIERATGQSASYGVAVLVPAAGIARGNPAAERLLERVAALLSAQRGFQRVLDYPQSHDRALIATGGNQTVLLAAFASQERSAQAVAAIRPRLAGSGVRFGGNDVTFNEISKRTSSDLRRAEMFAFPILLLLSFWVFRGLVAAVLPLLVGGFAIVITFLLLRLIDQFAGVSIFAVNLVTGIGLGLGIDYSLFVLSRYREELAQGREAGDPDPHAALRRTLNTAGRTVCFSAITVAGALASMLVFPIRFLYSMGIGGSLVALSAGAVSLIVLPAVLLALGPRIDALSPARLQRSADRTARAAESGAWFRLARGVMRRPGLIAALTATALVIVALPALHLSLAPADARVLPSSSEARQVSETLSHGYPVDASQTITTVTRAPAGGAQQVDALARRAQLASGSQAAVAPPRYLGRDTWEIDLAPRGTAASPANERLVRRLRALRGPSGAPSGTAGAAHGTSGAAQLQVGGVTAAFIDQRSAIAAHLPLALIALALLTGGFLFLMTGSLVLPFVALAMNLLTIAVGAGLLVLIFQDGHLSSLIGVRPIGGLEESNLVLLFVVAFALSTDYGVFLFGRIKEGHDRGLSTRDAIVTGLERTGRLITAAALLLCVAIGAFVTSHIFFIKQLGVGAALAVAIDATAVRALLLPALMGRLGELTWWAPAPLARLHARIGLREDAGGDPEADGDLMHGGEPEPDGDLMSGGDPEPGGEADDEGGAGAIRERLSGLPGGA
jgi:RND superfamily putative drug exporter